MLTTILKRSRMSSSLASPLGGQSVLKKKVKTLLSKTTSASSNRSEVLESLENLDIHPTTSSSADLLSSLSKRSDGSTLGVLENSNKLIDDLEALERDIASVYDLADGLEQAVLAARSESKTMLADRARLLESQKKASDQAEVLETFNELFSLSADHVAALERAKETVTVAFFEALERVQAIHANCRLLLRGNHRRAGLDLMDRMSNLQEKAYESLCRWVQTGMTTEDSYDDDDDDDDDDDGQTEGQGDLLLRRAIAALRTRPVLLKYCAEEVASSRHNAFFRKFLDTLTTPAMERERGRNPAAYVATIFDWVAKNVERERRLFAKLVDTETHGTHVTHGTAAEAGDAVTAATAGKSLLFLLDRALEGVCRPLETRLDQVMQQPTEEHTRRTRLVDLSRNCVLLKTKATTLLASLGEESALVGLVTDFSRKYRESLRRELSGRQRKVANLGGGGESQAMQTFLADLGRVGEAVGLPPPPKGAEEEDLQKYIQGVSQSLQ